MDSLLEIINNPVFIAAVTALLTGALPAYISFRLAKKRLEAEAPGLDAEAAQKLAAAAAQLVEEKTKLEQQKLEQLLTQQQTRIEEIEAKHERKRKQHEKELLQTRQQLALLIGYVGNVIDAFGVLHTQLIAANIPPEASLPPIPEGLEMEVDA